MSALSSDGPKFSIITPSLNQGRFLRDCLDSIQNQGWQNYEHFVVDGGSTDETPDILESYASRITKYVSEPDGGSAHAINKALAWCSGDIVAWLNADDYYLPGAFENIAQAWREKRAASFWFGNGLRVSETGETKAVFNPNPVVFDQNALLYGLDYILQPAAFINREILGKIGGLNVNLRWGFDWDLWIRLAEVSLPHPVDTPLAASREWGETLTANGGFRRAEELRQMISSHTGSAITAGTACYWLNTLARSIQQEKATFGDEVEHAARQLWYVMQDKMQHITGVDTLGMPVSTGNAITPLVVAVDLYPLLPGVSGGIVPWIEGVLRQMVRLYPMDQIVMFHRPGACPIDVIGDNVTFVPLHEHPKLFYDDMSRHIANANAQVIIRSYPQELHPDVPFEKQIFIIPDIQHEHLPHFFSRPVLATRRRAFSYALAGGGAVATMTAHSRNTILDNPWTSTDDVFLMPAALPEELGQRSGDGPLPSQLSAYSGYFYMPANLWPHKNHRGLFEAFRRAQDRLPPRVALVLSGNKEGYEDLVRGYEELPIVHLGFVPRDEVSVLLRGAIALAYFSLFEGFGMPLLEAFHFKTPVICSNTSALPEVGGDAVLSCDPTDFDAIAELLVRVASEDGVRRQLAAKGTERLSTYTWEAPARELRAAIKRRANAKGRPRAQPLVSIVMPTRNQGRFIRRSIDSVLSQDYPNIELFVMDGQSTDDTVEILKSYGDRIRWISEPDLGQADAINKGMARAKGEVLGYLNSDDIILPGAISQVVEHFSAFPYCDLVYGQADYIDQVGNVIGRYNTAEYTFERLMNDCCICQPATFWKKRAAERTGEFNASLQTAMDYEYWLRLAADGSIFHHLPLRLAQSRLHEEAKTLAMRGVIYKEIFEVCRREGGYVSFSYHMGLWSYRLFESWPGGRLIQRFFPGIYRLPALVHFALQLASLKGDRTARTHVSRTVFSRLDARYPPLGMLARKILQRIPRIRSIFS